MKTVSLTINGQKIRAREGEKILWAALDNGIYIPNLCALRSAAVSPASCRLCFVEIEGVNKPVLSCIEPVREGMIVNTKGSRALRLARTGFELLMSSHTVDCGHCSRNRSCELQKMAVNLRVRLKTNRFRKLERKLPPDFSSSVFIYDPNKCVLCGRCVWVCREQLRIGAFGFVRRGFDRVIATFGEEPIAQSCCQECGECVAVCPTGALTLKEKSAKVALAEK